MKKDIRLFAGIALVVNAITALVLFFIFLGKKKGIAGAFAAVAALTGAAGGYLLYEEKVIEALKEKKCCACDCDGDGDCENCDKKEECECKCKCDCEEKEDEELDIDANNLFDREEEANA